MKLLGFKVGRSGALEPWSLHKRPPRTGWSLENQPAARDRSLQSAWRKGLVETNDLAGVRPTPLPFLPPLEEGFLEGRVWGLHFEATAPSAGFGDLGRQQKWVVLSFRGGGDKILGRENSVSDTDLPHRQTVLRSSHKSKSLNKNVGNLCKMSSPWR